MVLAVEMPAESSREEHNSGDMTIASSAHGASVTLPGMHERDKSEHTRTRVNHRRFVRSADPSQSMPSGVLPAKPGANNVTQDQHPSSKAAEKRKTWRTLLQTSATSKHQE